MPWVPAMTCHLANGTCGTGRASVINTAILELEKPRGDFFLPVTLREYLKLNPRGPWLGAGGGDDSEPLSHRRIK